MATEAEAKVIAEFLGEFFGMGYRAPICPKEDEPTVKKIVAFVKDGFGKMKYPLGLAIDFALVAQVLSNHDSSAKVSRPKLTQEELFKRYQLVTERGGKKANTLTLTWQTTSIGIRKIEEKVVDLFVALNRPGYPSAYVYNTGQWQKFITPLLVPCFQLSEAGRYAVCAALIEFGLNNLTASPFLGREEERVRLFEEILRHYPRSDSEENAGAVFQGIAAGFMKADRPHLFLIVDKTRTGSAKQNRIGDIDGYYGLDLEVSVEVKDYPLTRVNVDKELGEFLSKVRDNRVFGLVFAAAADSDARSTIAKSGGACIDLNNALFIVQTWDWRKQDAAVNGMLHFLAHVEQNPDAVKRLLTFIASKDDSHDSLAYYGPATAISSE